MSFFETLLVCLHVMSNLVWIGSITTAGWLVARASRTDSKPTAELSLAVYKGLAVPGFVASFVFGVVRLLLSAGSYMHAHWFHGKLTFALAAIALHHIIGAKAKAVAAGSMQSGRSGAILVSALLACAFLSVVFVVFKTQLVP